MADILLASGSLNYSENGAAIAPGRDASLSGFEGLANFDGYSLTASLTGALASDRVELIASGSLKRDGRSILFNIDGTDRAIGSFTGGIGVEPLVIHFNAAATSNAVLAVLEGLGYFNTSEALVNGDRTLGLALANSNTPNGPSAIANRNFAVTGMDDSVQLFSRTVLFDGAQNATPDQPNASPDGAWFYALDLTKVPNDYPIINVPFPYSLAAGNQLDVRGQAIRGSASVAAGAGVTTMTSDLDAYAGISNYRFNYEKSDTFDEIVSLSNSEAQFDLELEPLRRDFPSLDRNTGYQLSFTSELVSESRTAAADKNGDGLADRAGFSVIVIGNDQKGIELGFWSDRIWAQNDGKSQQNPALEPDSDPQDPLRTFFTQGEGVNFNTQQDVQYDLSVQGDLYTLFADNSVILTGQLRDYSDFNPGEQVVLDSENKIPVIDQVRVFPPNPYAQENFIFLGDNTPTAEATVKLRDVSVSTGSNPAITLQPGAEPQIPTLSLSDIDGPTEQFVEAKLAVSSGTLTLATTVEGGVGSGDVTNNGTGLVTLVGSLDQINKTLAATNGLSYAQTDSALTSVPLNISANKAFRDSLALVGKAGKTLIGDGSFDQSSMTPMQPLITNQHWQIATTGEFLAAGKTDVIWHNSATGQLLLWQDLGEQLLSGSNETGLLPQQAIALPNVSDKNWSIKGNGQFNDDSKLDLLWYNTTDQRIAVWYMDNGERVGQGEVSIDANLQTELEGYQLQGSGDFDGNGAAEFLWTKASAPALLTDLNTSGGALSLTTAAALSETPGNDFVLASIGSYNSRDDQRDDIAWLTGNTATPYQVWQMNGTSVQKIIDVASI